mmetsp:Transcript_10731/g.45687  ORF Transcript_10731/g.45687 Transcript_10731/m.45687 type:complete len:245 (-) Transcript_10731:330-1064(-)
MGAGLNRSSAKINESASKLRWPPESSVRLSFQTPPNATRTSRPARKLSPSGGSSFALAEVSSVEKMEPKSAFTLVHVTFKASFFFSSSSEMTASIFARSFSTIRRFSCSALNSDSALSNIAITFLLIFLARVCCVASASASSAVAAIGSRVVKSYSPFATPNRCDSVSIHGWSSCRRAKRVSESEASFAARLILCSICFRATASASARLAIDASFFFVSANRFASAAASDRLAFRAEVKASSVA